MTDTAENDAPRLDCAQRCEIPAGVTLTEVPPSRHAWSDVVMCPNDGCGKQFLTRVLPPGQGDAQ